MHGQSEGELEMEKSEWVSEWVSKEVKQNEISYSNTMSYICGPRVAALMMTVMRIAKVNTMEIKDTCQHRITVP